MKKKGQIVSFFEQDPARKKHANNARSLSLRDEYFSVHGQIDGIKVMKVI